ncbi:hypothetical protein SAMN04488134_106119 [Amphibacillus marinus]|uniref:Uncharacterized protein n=1 Tax=Amphibacillus marinus TaxID=872970 RepID=A0A1H8NVP2_9BACI|nr:hypothetical protein [Amphibacillus marinus]SEO33644.1 hypothetical protein SAMN04488134_106119 [Amphibacillus marinus]
MKKICTILICMVLFFSNVGFISANQLNEDESSLYVEVVQELNDEGMIEATIITENGSNEVVYNPENGETYLDGVLLEVNFEEADIQVQPFSNDPGGSGNGGLFYLGTTRNYVPVGTTISVAAGLITIWTGFPTSKIIQSIIVVAGGTAMTKLDKVLEVETKQYRTTKKVQDSGMCYPQYKYQNQTRYIYKGKYSKWNIGALFLGSKPC